MFRYEYILMPKRINRELDILDNRLVVFNHLDRAHCESYLNPCNGEKHLECHQIVPGLSIESDKSKPKVAFSNAQGKRKIL